MTREKPISVTPTATNEELCQWLTERFSGDEYAQRIQVCQWVNNQRGEVVLTIDQKIPDATDAKKKANKPRLAREKLVELSHKIVAAAQAHCDALRRSTVYAVLAFHLLKAPDSYTCHTFRLAPKNAYVPDGTGSGGVDTDEVHRDRLLSVALAHSRWQTEQFADAIGGVMALQQDIIRQQADTIARQDAERRQWIIVSEEALSRKQEREIAAAWAKAKIDAVNDTLAQAKVLLPAIVGALTKSKVGVSEGIKAFAEGLSEETQEALFGKWERDELEKPGILDENQCRFFVALLRGQIDPSRIAEFAQSLRPEQMMAAQKVLTQKQIESLMFLAGTATKDAPTAPSAP